MGRPRQTLANASRWVRETSEGCWLWCGYRDRDGYGKVTVARHPEMAHRYFYAEIIGPIPARLQLDHLCRRRACVNPFHVEPVTGAVNIGRGNTGLLNRQKKRCIAGHSFNTKNTRTSNGRRFCRTCDRNNARTRRQHQRERRLAGV